MAHPRHKDVRRRYRGRCGYCDVAEAETGGELTVDHYQPTSAGGDDSEDNLVYCCFRCNSYKGDFVPTPEDMHHGFRILHPLLDDLTLHLRENPHIGALEPLTETGRFHIDLLYLNRPQLIELRLPRKLHGLLTESYTVLRDENEHLRFQIVLLEHYLKELERREKKNARRNEPNRLSVRPAVPCCYRSWQGSRLSSRPRVLP